MAVHPQTLTGSSEKVQQDLRKHEEQKESVSAVARLDADGGQTHSYMLVFRVAKLSFNRETASVQIHDLKRQKVSTAAGQVTCPPKDDPRKK